MENIDDMRKRHKDEVKALRDKCKHKKSTRLGYIWTLGRYWQEVKVCDFCGKILESNNEIPASTTTVSKSNVYKPISKIVRVDAIGKPSAGKRDVIIPIVSEGGK